MITIGNFKDISDEYDEVWLIVRSLKTVPYIPNTQVFHIPALSPSPELFQCYLSWRNAYKWNRDMFHKQYVPRFLKEMKEELPRHFLNTLYIRAKSKHILLACFCPDESLCHRSIVCGLMQGVGCETSANDYRHYYTLYKEV